jgi:hypothetical protein
VEWVARLAWHGTQEASQIARARRTCNPYQLIPTSRLVCRSSPPTREERAARGAAVIGSRFNDKQQVFLTFILSHYVSDGVEELDQAKLAPLLQLKYGSTHDAVAQLGRPDEIGRVFSGFQQYLYQASV